MLYIATLLPSGGSPSNRPSIKRASQPLGSLTPQPAKHVLINSDFCPFLFVKTFFVSCSFISIMAETAVRIDRELSIENEPKTLRFHQIQCAREAALYVVSTKSIEEAMRIFTEGLEPAVSVARSGNSDAMMEMEEVDDLNELPQTQGAAVRDIVSAPF